MKLKYLNFKNDNYKNIKSDYILDKIYNEIRIISDEDTLKQILKEFSDDILDPFYEIKLKFNSEEELDKYDFELSERLNTENSPFTPDEHQEIYCDEFSQSAISSGNIKTLFGREKVVKLFLKYYVDEKHGIEIED